MENLERDIQLEEMENEDYANPQYDEIAELITKIAVDPVELNTENLYYLDYDEDKFKKGIKDTSYVCGQITALLNIGMTREFVADFILNSQINDYNLNSLKLSNDTNLAIARVSSGSSDKNTL